MVQVLFCTFDEDHLILIAAMAAHDDAPAIVAPFHAEIAVELLAGGGVRHGQGDMLQ
jgi:hypothetical protein